MIRRLLINTSSNISVMVIKLAITFIMTPIFVRNLGKYDYGLWEMLGAVLGYMGMLDLGLKPALSRFAAKFQAENDPKSLAHVYASGLVFMGAIGLLLCFGFLLWAVLYPGILAREGAPVSRYAALLVIIGIQLVFRFPGFVAESFLEGFQKYYLKNNITIFNSIVGSTVLYFLITPQNGLVLLALINSVGLSLKYVVYAFLLTRESHGGLRPDVRYFDIQTLKRLLSFGFKSFIQGVSTRIENATDSLIIGIILGPAMVPFYSIPANLVRYVGTLGHTLTHAFMPLFSGFYARSENEKMRQMYLFGSKYVVSIILPLSAGIIMVGGPFLGVWIGPEFREKGDLIVLLLVLFTALPMMNPFDSRYLTALGRHAIFARLKPLAAFLNIGLSLILIHPMGIVGVALASLISVFIFVPIFLQYVCRHLEIEVRQYLRKSIVPCLLPTLIMSALVSAIRFKWGLDSYAMIIGASLLGVFSYFLMFWFFSLGSDERGYILRRIPGIATG